MSEIINEVFETPKVEKPKKKRKPMTPEAKQALIERLAAGRAAKKNKKKEQKVNLTMDIEPPTQAKEPEAKQPEAPKPDNSAEMKALQDQLNAMKLEKLEALEKKNEKKKAAIEKRRATMNRKAIERAQKNEVTKPAPIRKPVEKMEVIEEQAEQTQAEQTPTQAKQTQAKQTRVASRKMSINDDNFGNTIKKLRYSTFKKSVWSSL